MIYRILADAAMVVHFLFVAYVVLGGFLAWRYPKAWFPHAAVALYGLIITVYSIVCPLTPLEDRWRRRAGQSGLEPTGFIDTYIEGVIYPGQYADEVRWAAAAVIAVSWIGALALHLRRRRRRRQSTGAGSDRTGRSDGTDTSRRSHKPNTANATSSEPTVNRWFSPTAAVHPGAWAPANSST
ncbi:hypothetical protein GCM10027447_35730 [Glycomyces halotolerans]